MSLTDGEKLTQARLRRLQSSIPTNYTIYKDGSTYRAETNDAGGTDYDDPDAATVIQNALSALTTGKILIKNGTYDLRSTIVVGSNKTVMGEGKSTILQVGAAYAAANSYVFSATSNNVFANFVIDGNSKSYSLPACAIGFIPAASVDNNLIPNVEIKNIKQGIMLSGNGGNNNQILNNHIHNLYCNAANPGGGIATDATNGDYNNTTIRGNHLHDLGYLTAAGIAVLGTTDGTYKQYKVVITNNIIEEITNGDAIQLYFHNYDSIVSENTIKAWDRSAIKLDGSQRNTVSNNTIYDSNDASYDCQYGIHIYARNDQDCDENTVTNNVLHTYKSEMAIMIEGTAGKTVLGNRATGNVIYRTNDTAATHGAIWLSYAGVGTIVDNNYVRYPRAHGIYVESTCGSVVVQGNIINNSGFSAGTVGHGIFIDADKCVVKDNFIINTGVGGTANTCSGIFIDSDDNTITNNTIRDDTAVSKYCIEEDTGQDDNFIFGNLVVGGSTGQIAVVGSGTIARNNSGYNPVGVIATPFDTTNDLLELNGDSAVPVSTKTYVVCTAGCYINSTDSGGADCDIAIQDADGVLVYPQSGTVSTLNGVYVPRGYKITWGTFSGADPTVVVSFI